MRRCQTHSIWPDTRASDVIPIGLLFAAGRLASGQSGTGGIGHKTSIQLLYWMCVVGGCGFVSFILFVAASTAHDKGDIDAAITLGAWALVVALPGIAMLVPSWWWLKKIAAGGHVKTAYYLAHLFALFVQTGETYGGASVLAAYALSRRGNVTRAELVWLERRIWKQAGDMGTFGAAHALGMYMEAKLLRAEGRTVEASHVAQRARVMLGTITYMSNMGCQRGVRSLVHELLSLDEVRAGQWGGVLSPIRFFAKPTPVHKELIDWVNHTLSPAPGSPPSEKKRTRPHPAAHALMGALASRAEQGPLADGEEEALARATATFKTLQAGGEASTRELMLMLNAYDVQLYPEAPSTRIPESRRQDEGWLNQVQDDVATALTDLLRYRDIPIHALPLGPISARVYEQLELALTTELANALEVAVARSHMKQRSDALSEWVEASYVRSVFRRLERTLGPAAAARHWPSYKHGYTALGVHLSETWFRMRPLAHAVFASLLFDAERFSDPQHVTLQRKNCGITGGLE
jgi:hypothetical protein